MQLRAALKKVPFVPRAYALLRLLRGHPGASVAFATAESAAGESVEGHELIKADDAPWQEAEIVLSALPHGVSGRYVQEARAGGKRAVDLSADDRKERHGDNSHHPAPGLGVGRGHRFRRAHSAATARTSAVTALTCAPR